MDNKIILYIIIVLIMIGQLVNSIISHKNTDYIVDKYIEFSIQQETNKEQKQKCKYYSNLKDGFELAAKDIKENTKKICDDNQTSKAFCYGSMYTSNSINYRFNEINNKIKEHCNE